MCLNNFLILALAFFAGAQAASGFERLGAYDAVLERYERAAKAPTLEAAHDQTLAGQFAMTAETVSLRPAGSVEAVPGAVRQSDKPLALAPLRRGDSLNPRRLDSESRVALGIAGAGIATGALIGFTAGAVVLGALVGLGVAVFICGIWGMVKNMGEAAPGFKPRSPRRP